MTAPGRTITADITAVDGGYRATCSCGHRTAIETTVDEARAALIAHWGSSRNHQ